MNQSPADFRKNSERIAESSAFSHGESLDFADENEDLISIEYLADILVVYERRKGNIERAF